MRILHVYKDYPPILGGIENHVRLLAEGQAACGHDVTALVTSPKGDRSSERVEGGVRVVRAARVATVASTPLSPALIWQLGKRKTDVVHLHFPYPLGEVAQWLLRRGCATVLTYHSDIVRQAGILRAYRPLLARVLGRVDAIIVGSPPMRKSHYLVGLESKLHVIPYGVPLARFRAEPDSATLARLRGTVGAGSILLFVGRLRYYKGLDHLIRALPLLGRSVRLVVAGVGQMEQAWHLLAADLCVADRVDWLGEVSDADLPALYHLADLFVLPASEPSEAFGLVQVEAMAAGLPVVSTELGTGTSYVNQHGVTGLVVEPRNPEALAGAIQELLDHPDRRATLASAARERVEAEFDLDVMVGRVLHLYTSLPPLLTCGKMP